MYTPSIWLLATSVIAYSTFLAHANAILTSQRKHPRDVNNADTALNSGVFLNNDPDTVTTISLIRTSNDQQHSSLSLRRLIAQLSPPRAQSQPATLPLFSTGTTFLAPITIGTQTFLTVLDTGSSDTWIASSNFTCLDPLTRRQIPPPRCAFGPTYSQSPPVSTSNTSNNSGRTYHAISNENFNITYGDGEFLTGTLGTIDVTFAGLTVRNQTISLVDRAAWRGDGRSSGIVGLAYPALTAAFPGTDPSRDRYCAPGLDEAKGECNSLVYPSLMDSLFFHQGQGQTQASEQREKVFALALSRDESRRGDGGVLTVGGVPLDRDLERLGVKMQMKPARGRGRGRGQGQRGVKLARTKIQMLQGDDRFRYYVIDVDGFVVLAPGTPIPDESSGGNGRQAATENFQGGVRFNADGSAAAGEVGESGSMNNEVESSLRSLTNRAPPPLPSSSLNQSTGNKISYVLDTGTTLSFLPSTLTTRFNTLMSGHIDPASGLWLVLCNATPPPLGITIAGTTFWHNAKDLIKPYDFAGRICVSGIQDSRMLGRTGISILGDVFLDSVLAVFDLGKGEIGFAGRREYVS